jgi:hypothetical protein
MLCGTPRGGTASRSAIRMKATKVGQEFAERRITAPALILTAAWIVIRAHQLEFWTSSECGSTGIVIYAFMALSREIFWACGGVRK